MTKKNIILTGLVLLVTAAAAVLIHHHIYVTAIRDIRILNMPEDGYQLTRHTEDVKLAIAAKVEADNQLASRELLYESSNPEVVEVTEEGVLIGKNPGNPAAQLDSFFPDQSHIFADTRCQFTEVQSFFSVFSRSVFHAGKVQHLLNELGHLPALSLNHLQILPIAF